MHNRSSMSIGYCPSHPCNAGAEHVGVSPTTQTSRRQADRDACAAYDEWVRGVEPGRRPRSRRGGSPCMRLSTTRFRRAITFG